MIQRILEFQIAPPVPLPYVLVGIVLVLVVGVFLLWRVLK